MMIGKCKMEVKVNIDNKRDVKMINERLKFIQKIND